MMSVMAGALPLYGTWRTPWMPAIELKSSVKRCAVAPVPEEEKVYFAGFDLISAMKALASAAGNEGFTTSANGAAAIRLTGVRSFIVSYGIFCRFGMIEIGPLDAASSV